MAKTNATAAETKTRTYVLEVTFTVDFTADEDVQSPQAIRNEARSWLDEPRRRRAGGQRPKGGLMPAFASRRERQTPRANASGRARGLRPECRGSQ